LSRHLDAEFPRHEQLEDFMFHVQLMGYGSGAHHGHFETLEEAVSVTESRPYGRGQYQEVIATEIGLRMVRANGNEDWMTFNPNRPRTGGWA
jgi:hypothetical protein